MKLFIFVPSLTMGGAERVACLLANHWAAKDWEVHVAVFSGREDFYQLHPYVQRHFFKGYTSSNIFQAVHNNCSVLKQTRLLLKSIQPDTALGVMTTPNCLLALAALGTGIPAVGAEHIYPPMIPLSRIWETARRRTYPLLCAVAALTTHSARWLQQHAGVRRAPVIPNAVCHPLPVLDPVLPPPQKTPQQRLLLTAGRLEPQKGFDRLLPVFAKLAPRHPLWRLVILGDGGQRPELERQVQELELADRVSLPGAAGNIGQWYDTADLYVMSSRFEGFPNTLLEALAHGLPAVSVDCETGPGEIIRHEIDGLLVPQADPQALTNALDRLMADHDLRRQYSLRAVEARERFSIERIACMWEELFANLAAETQRSRKAGPAETPNRP